MKKLLAPTIVLLAGLLIMTSAGLTGGLEIGDKAPDFRLKNIDGKMFSLKDIKDADGNAPKGYIVTFTCNTCPFAKMYEDRLIALHEKMAPKGWPVVAIQPNDPDIMPGDSFENMKKRAKQKGFPFVYLLDEEQTVYPAYGAERTPHIFLLDKDRTVHYIGTIDDNPQNAEAVNRKYVEEAIAALESGKEVDPKVTKAIGCNIKSR
jgi:peroxiredoxin